MNVEKMKSQQVFLEAFNRLKQNHPERMPKGTKVSQNNVAKEAGCDPSALRKSRYPELIAEIQMWLSLNPKASRANNTQLAAKQKSINKGYKNRICELTMQRDEVAELLVEADLEILELSQRIVALEALLPKNVVGFRENVKGKNKTTSTPT